MAAHTQDDGFHEIQLNGKQLVFLFMAATVVSVVIFSAACSSAAACEPSVGVKPRRRSLSAPAEPAPQQAASPATPTPAGSDPTTAAAAPPAVDDLSYFNRLQSDQSAAGEAEGSGASRRGSAGWPNRCCRAAGGATASAAAPPTPTTVPRAATPPTEKEPASDAAPGRDAATSGAPAGTGGYAVQIAALNIRSEADAIAKRLSAKGLCGVRAVPAAGTPQIYRVRIGKFGSRREAETIAAKLEKEEQFKPWVTR